MNGAAVALLSLLSGASQGYFTKKQQLSAEAQKQKQEEQKLLKDQADKVYKYNLEMWKETADPFFGKALGLSPEHQQVYINFKKKEEAAKAAGKEGKPSVSAAAGKMSKTSKKQTGAITEPIMGGEITGPPMRMGTQLQTEGGQIGTTTGYTPEMQQLEQLGNVMEFEKAAGRQAPQQYREEAGFEPKPQTSKIPQVTPNAIFTARKTEIRDNIQDINKKINTIRGDRFYRMKKDEFDQEIVVLEQEKVKHRKLLAKFNAYVEKTGNVPTQEMMDTWNKEIFGEVETIPQKEVIEGF